MFRSSNSFSNSGSCLKVEMLTSKMVQSVACATDMTLFGYDQGVFGMFPTC